MTPAANTICPTCHRAVEWSEKSPWRPFCSQRCKIVDLGAWASGKHVIHGQEADLDDFSNTSTTDCRD